MDAQIELGGSEPTALLVEDERDLNTLITYHLERNGIKTTSAVDGEIGLMLATRNSYDIIILDLMLPSVSGLEISRLLQARQPTPPIIIVTAVSPEIVRSITDKLHATHIVYKPFKPQELINSVCSAIHYTPRRHSPPDNQPAATPPGQPGLSSRE